MTNRQLTKKIKKLDNEIELKHKDESFQLGQVDANFSVYDICVVGLGGDERGRIGDEIVTTSLKMRSVITWTPNAFNNNTCLIRMILFWDAAPNGEVPSIIPVTPLDQAVLDNSNTAFTPIHFMYDYSTTQDRFRIIYDKVWSLSSQYRYSVDDIEFDGNPAIVTKFISKKFKLGRKQIFAGDGADYTTMVTNGIYAGWYFYSPNASTSEFNSLIIDSTFRLYYKDP